MRYEFSYPNVAAAAPADARAAFIRRTYAHLAGAIAAFIGLEALLVTYARSHEQEIFGLLVASRFSWLIVLLMFMGASWLAQTWARSEASPGLQYAGLALYVVAEAIIFLPLLYIATYYTGDPYLIPKAGILTLGVFGGLTLSVFITRKDYSFLGPILSVAGFIALGVIIAGILFQFTLGLFFCFAMVALLSGYILYDTSNVMLHYRTTQHVAAALALFASVATLFWYILRILMILNRSR
jgi:FtsH-binding integral membrane protein